MKKNLVKDRTVKIKNNMVISGVFKAATMLLSFLIVKVTYVCLDTVKFGVWMTILSVLSWIAMFDFGLGNGLRNKLSESNAKEDWKQGKIYVSTTYALIGILVLIMAVISVIVINYSNLSVMFNVNEDVGRELKYSLLWIIILYLVNFMLSLINIVAFAFHDSAMPDIIRFCTNLGIYIAYYAVSKSTVGSLFLVGFLYSFITVSISLLATIYLFAVRYKKVAPNINNIEMKHVRELFSLSIGFFVIGLAGLVIFTTDNMIITQVLGPQEVSPYQIVYKLFSIFTIGFGIVLAPMWSGFTDAYVKRDSIWIKNTLKKLLILMIPIVLGVLLIIILAKPIIRLWMGKDVGASNLLIILTGVYTVQSCWNTIFAYFVNGIGRIKVQIYTAVTGGVINIPLSIYFARNCGMGSSGVILGTIFSLLLGTIIIPIQTYSIIRKELKG